MAICWLKCAMLPARFPYYEKIYRPLPECWKGAEAEFCQELIGIYEQILHNAPNLDIKINKTWFIAMLLEGFGVEFQSFYFENDPCRSRMFAIGEYLIKENGEILQIGSLEDDDLRLCPDREEWHEIYWFRSNSMDKIMVLMQEEFISVERDAILAQTVANSSQKTPNRL